MDFFHFLQNNNNTNNKTSISINNTKNSYQESSKQNSSKPSNLSPIIKHSNLKAGDPIKIIFYPNSEYNSYKGYSGEIKDYRKSQSFALVYVYTSTSTKQIRLPLEHFIKVE